MADNIDTHPTNATDFDISKDLVALKWDIYQVIWKL